MEEIYLAGYDFWKYQKYFSYMDGVAVVEVGYMENKSSITKEAVNQDGGLVEVLHLIYDSDLISLDQILDLFFYQVDPMNKKKEINQSGVFYTDLKDKIVIEEAITHLQSAYTKKLQVECGFMTSFIPLTEEELFLYRKSLFKKQKKMDHKTFLYVQNKNKENVLKKISKQQYRILYLKEKEEAYHNRYWDFFEEGIYVDVLSKEPLFLSCDKLSSSTGYPMFKKTIAQTLKGTGKFRHIFLKQELETKDHHYLGCVFYQKLWGSPRFYSVNSACLQFIPLAQMRKEGYSRYIKELKK